MVLEKTVESPLDCKEIQPVHSEGDQPWDFFGISSWGTDLDYCDTEWFALETNRDHSVIFETAPKYYISYSFVDDDGYSISSRGFLPTVVDIMVI